LEDCVFCKIIAGKIPCNKVYEDEDILAFHDIHPAAPVHFIVIPKLHIASLAEVDLGHQMLLGKMLALASKLAIAQGCGDGWRTIINTGRIGRQEVYHLHIHIIGGNAVLPGMTNHIGKLGQGG
jgi:histidine triad (HIT) family protein